MRNAYPALLLLLALPAFAQNDTVVAGVIADSSIVAPIVSWNRTTANASTLSLTLSGWTISVEGTRRRTPRGRGVVSIALTPIHAYSGDRIYVNGERARELEFDASAIEATFGRIDLLGERWISDIRFIAIQDRIEKRANTYGGIRTRQAWRRITAEDPLLLTFEGGEVGGVAEILAGDRTWSRIKLDQRFSRKWGRLRAGESVVAFHGRSLDRASEFLLGGSWPAGDLRPLYGYRYAELRLDRGVGINADISYAIAPSLILGAHAGVLRSRDLDAHGVAVDVATSWRGIGIRAGGARGDNQTVLYASVLVARFIR